MPRIKTPLPSYVAPVEDHAAHPGLWHMLEVSDVEQVLDVSAAGLTTVEAAARLARHGPNEVEAEKETPWWVLLRTSSPTP